MIFQSNLSTFLPDMLYPALQPPLAKEDVLTEEFLLREENQLRMYYAPHNEFIHTGARLVFVGITPGWQQTKTAYESVIDSAAKKESKETMLKKAKIAAGFAGTMRHNLFDMLDEISLPHILGWHSAEKLFAKERKSVHTTSFIRYPVFLNNRNYTGHTPHIANSRLLKEYAFTVFPEEIRQLTSPALIIPLGKAAEKVISQLKDKAGFKQHTILSGFPHPSGANGHRKKQLKEHKTFLKKVVQQFGKQLK